VAALLWLPGTPVAYAQQLQRPVATPVGLEQLQAGPEAATAIPPILGRIDPDTYRVGPGDAFALRVSDLVETRVFRVNGEGAILLPDVGAVDIGGLTLREAEAKVREALRPFVRGKGLVFTLQVPRRFRVAVLGEVANPGPVTLQAPARASEAIAAAGGVGPQGARRGIEVRRGAGTVPVDLVRFERAGDLDANPLVFETDVVFVPASGARLEVRGAVPHEGRYDFARGDRLSTLLLLAGGTRPEASLPDAMLERFVDSVRTERMPVDLSAAQAAPGSDADLELRDGDRLFVPGRSNWKQGASVEVRGEVARPGSYPIAEGVDRARSVLERAGGLTERADTAAAHIQRETTLRAATRDSALFLFDAEREGLLLEQDRQIARVRSLATPAVSADLGALLLRGDARQDVLLLDGDRIVVPRRHPFVIVQGEVKRPGAVSYRAGWRAEDYVREAGGGTHRSDPGHARVTLAATGREVHVKDVAALEPGDVLWVPAKKDRNTWAGVRDVITVAAQLSAIYLVFWEATR
jgi:protein involved in polysaccharide export with SLBB domain